MIKFISSTMIFVQIALINAVVAMAIWEIVKVVLLKQEFRPIVIVIMVFIQQI
jgi:hypothetical protein